MNYKNTIAVQHFTQINNKENNKINYNIFNIILSHACLNHTRTYVNTKPKTSKKRIEYFYNKNIKCQVF